MFIIYIYIYITQYIYRETHIKLKRNLCHHFSVAYNFYRVSLLATNRIILENAAVFFQGSLNYANNSIYCRQYSMTPDIIESRIFKPPTCKRKASTNICISFLNKGVKFINVPRICHDPSVLNLKMLHLSTSLIIQYYYYYYYYLFI